MKFLNFSNRFKKLLSSQRGFTLVEAIVALSIFLTVMAMVTGLFTDSFANKRKIELSRTLYEEARIALERIVKEIRRGTIDYEEYWNRFQHQSGETANSFYGENYGDYARQFYRDSDGNVPAVVTRFHENVGEDSGVNPLGNANPLAVCVVPAMIPAAPGASGYEQCELYIITAEGTEKTVIKLIPETVGTEIEYRLAMMKLPGTDSNADGQVDEWIIAGEGGTANPSPSGFYDFCDDYDAVSKICEDAGYKFQKIQPDSIKITSLKFYISPLEDPRKAFAEFTAEVQQQPHITIELTVEPSAAQIRGIRGDVPVVTLQTTVGARAQNEVKSLR